MVKPTTEQLMQLYPKIDVEYLSNHIDRKLLLIEAEDDVVLQIQTLIEKFKTDVSGVLYLPIGNKEKIIKQKLDDLEFQIADIEIDAIIQLHETSGYLYQWILEKHFSNIPIKTIGGEQTTAITRKNLLKQDIQKLVEKTIDRNQTISTSISGSLKSLRQDINRLNKQKEINIKDINRAFDTANKRITSSTRGILQQAVYDAESEIEIETDDKYISKYYRVEVLDTSICMTCMSLDGEINDTPIGLVHKNCRGIDILLLQDIETSKYYDINGKGYGHKLKTRTFEQKFNSLSAKQKRSMLGKNNYELYSKGKLKPNDFLSNGRQITNAEAQIKLELKRLRKDINTPNKATRLSNYIDNLFTEPISLMDEQTLNAYEKCLGIQKQIYENVPNKAFTGKTKQSYIDAIDAKYDEINKLRK